MTFLQFAILLSFFLASLLVFCGNFLHGVLVAVVLLDVFSVFRIFSHLLLLLLFVTVKLLIVFLFLYFFTHAFVLKHHLVFLNHSLQVLKDHFAGQKASNEGLHLDYADQSAFVNFDAILVVLLISFFFFLRRVFNVIVLVLRMLMLLFVGSDHHIITFFLVAVVGAMTIAI